MTEKLYDSFPYEKVFKASVLEINESDARTVLVLDKTLFFPLEGGQSCDKGSINGMAVLDVQIKDGVIYHTVDAQAGAFNIGQSVEGSIDWAHRFSNMQQHSAEHIFSGIVHKKYAYENVGFHLSDNICTMDFSGPLDKSQIAEIEYLVNEAIWKNVGTRCFFPTAEEQAELSWRSKKTILENLRLVEIEGYDLCACCAPHVARTGEIGAFKVLSSQSYKGGVRISYLAGKRAYLHTKAESELLQSLYNRFSANSDTLLDAIEGLSTDRDQLRQKLAEYMERDIKDAIYSSNGEPVFLEDADTNIARTLAVGYTKEVNQDIFVFILCEKGYKYILSTCSQDARNIQEALAKKLNARGGGSKNLVCGSLCANMEEIRDAIQGIKGQTTI